MSWEPRPDLDIPGVGSLRFREDAILARVAPSHSDLGSCRVAVRPAGPLSPTLPPELFAVPADVIDAALSRLPQLDLPLRNFYAPGIYGRELTIPAGTLLTGRRHKDAHLFMVHAGEITIWGDDVPPEVVTGPHTCVGGRGARRVGYAHSDVVCTTVFRNPDNLRDPDAILDLWTEVPPIPADLVDGRFLYPAVLTRMLLLSGSADTGDHALREVL
jgi:hypothetical protein